jgi:thymidylate synthase (FAD)
MAFNQILVELQDVFGDDRRIAESAWTSSLSLGKKEFKSDADVERVVKMLGGSKPPHGVPFESVLFYFWIRMPIISDRQYVTHRIQSMNGMSGRYRTMPDDFYLIPDDVALTLNRLGMDDCIDEYNQICLESNEWYRAKLKALRIEEDLGLISNAEYKRAREILRGVLPQANMTERTATINLRSFANLQKQRNDSHAAPEMQVLAQKMLDEVEASGKIPVALSVLKENGWIV